MLAASPALAANDPPTGASLAAYVRARAAAADGAADIAARGYAIALADDPGNEVIAIRAFREGIAVGDFDLARRALAVLERSNVAPADTVMLRYADRVRARDWPAARAAAAQVAQGPLDFVGPVLLAWVAFEEGAADPAAELAAAEANVISRRYAAENRALLLIAQGQYAQAADALSALLGNDQASLDLRLNAAQLFQGKRQGKLARELLGGSDPVLVAQRSSLGRGAKAGAAFGASRLFTRLAADLGRDEASPLSILLGRTALLLDPTDDRARLLLADTLSQQGLGTRALALLDSIGAKSAFASVAQAARVTVLTRMEDEAGALAAAKALADAPGATVTEAQSYGDLLVDQNRFDDAAAAYATAMARAGDGADWVLNLQRGGALEQAGRWDEALPYLRRAVELAPQEPVALNYLGYAQVERGENLAEGQKLLEQARALRPDDPSITDSLGWAYVQRGQWDKGLPLLEQAAAAEPGDVTINEHLGDAYWRTGRRYEARYAWRAAAVHAEGDDAKRLAGKLADGLAPVTAAR
ncbi:tetratricopeptide repeat protein [Sphingomonas qomolangmaensis]|uniref:Tetratricopeptide repeat protein n=1 Tax=Sphingomonas qomolangmaensis TaxID=2918765 RepID=A0ABY5LBP6_9SPHN|nr:tetratricopeptide repeat protein [Sphingomonas qomolangmaensis]UUL83526.1 tetratricopeptide repeat protein [Sphingomonas qomolangmaensis]